MKECLAPVNKQQRTWIKIFIRVKRCCTYGGIGKELFITNCLNGTKQLSRNSYVQQMERLNMAIQNLIDSIDFFCCTTTLTLISRKITKKTIRTHDWEVLLYPQYFLDLAQTDFYIFWYLSNGMHRVSLNTDVEREFIKWIFGV